MPTLIDYWFVFCVFAAAIAGVVFGVGLIALIFRAWDELTMPGDVEVPPCGHSCCKPGACELNKTITVDFDNPDLKWAKFDRWEKTEGRIDAAVDAIQKKPAKVNITRPKKPAKRWSTVYDCCIQCGSDSARYQSRGLCTNCYSRKRRKAAKSRSHRRS